MFTVDNATELQVLRQRVEAKVRDLQWRLDTVKNPLKWGYLNDTLNSYCKELKVIDDVIRNAEQGSKCNGSQVHKDVSGVRKQRPSQVPQPEPKEVRRL